MKQSKSAYRSAMDRSVLRGARTIVRRELLEIAAERKAQAKQISVDCKAGRRRLKERRAAVLAALKQERQAEAEACRARHTENIAAAKTKAEKARAKRALAVQGYEISRKVSGSRATGIGSRGPMRKAEARTELLDAARDDLEWSNPELVEIWDRVKHTIKPKPTESYAEAFLEWVHDNREEVAASKAMLGDQRGAALAREAKRIDREIAKLPRGPGGWKGLMARQKRWQGSGGQSPAEAAWDSLHEHGRFLSAEDRYDALTAIIDAIGATLPAEKDHAIQARLGQLQADALRAANQLRPTTTLEAIPF